MIICDTCGTKKAEMFMHGSLLCPNSCEKKPAKRKWYSFVAKGLREVGDVIRRHPKKLHKSFDIGVYDSPDICQQMMVKTCKEIGVKLEDTSFAVVEVEPLDEPINHGDVWYSLSAFKVLKFL